MVGHRARPDHPKEGPDDRHDDPQAPWPEPHERKDAALNLMDDGAGANRNVKLGALLAADAVRTDHRAFRADRALAPAATEVRGDLGMLVAESRRRVRLFLRGPFLAEVQAAADAVGGLEIILTPATRADSLFAHRCKFELFPYHLDGYGAVSGARVAFQEHDLLPSSEHKLAIDERNG